MGNRHAIVIDREERMTAHHALVTGAHGIVGLNLVQELAQRGDWKVTATGRRGSLPVPDVEYIAADLTDADALRLALAGCSDITHLFFAAFRYNADPYEEIAVNMAILGNTLDALKATGANLQRVVNYQGGKAYGALYGNVRAPAKESDPRVPGPLFYYEQEDMLYARGAKESFATTILRPDYVQGIGLGSYVSIVNTLAAYGTVCRALGQPLFFPGGEAAFHALFQMTDARLLARGSICCARGAFAEQDLQHHEWRPVPLGQCLGPRCGLFWRADRSATHHGPGAVYARAGPAMGWPQAGASPGTRSRRNPGLEPGLHPQLQHRDAFQHDPHPPGGVPRLPRHRGSSLRAVRRDESPQLYSLNNQAAALLGLLFGPQD
jgi:nucleoside-diphosphate-sugar epimerase